MGIFSSKRRTYVDTTAVRIVEDKLLPDTPRSALVKAVLTGQEPVDQIQRDVLGGAFRKFEQMYNYAKNGDYVYGLPDARVLSSSAGDTHVKAAIESEEGATVTMDYVYFRPLNHIHEARRLLVRDYGYNPTTNIIETLSVSVGFPVYLQDLVATHQTDAAAPTEATALGVWGGSARSGGTPSRLARFAEFGIGSLVSEQAWRSGPTEIDGAEVEYTWQDADKVVHTSTLFIDLSAADPDQEFFQAQYRIAGQIKYWTYAPETGTHPTLDDLYVFDYTNPGTYFPFAMFRRNRQNRTAVAVSGTPEYLTTERLLKYIGIDFAEMGEQIHSSPDIEDVDQAVLMMAVPATSQNEVEMEYLFRFFKRLASQTPAGGIRTVSSIASLSKGTAPTYALEIKDADFRMVLSYTAIRSRLVAGVIGPVGSFSNTSETVTSDLLDSLDVPTEPQVVRYYRRQVTSQVYDEVAITQPVMRYDITEEHFTEGGATDDLLLIPIDRDIAMQMSVLDRETLYFRSLHLVANSRVVVKTKWYESGFFKTLLSIVAIVITVVSLGAGFKAIAAASTLWATAVVIATLALQYVVADFVFEQVVRWVGPEVAMALATIAAVWGGARALTKGGVGTDAWAENLLKASSGLTGKIQSELGRLYAEFMSDVEAFQLLVEDRWKELEEANKLLSNKDLLNPFTFVGQQPLVLFGESPDAYYRRTIHAGNPGAMSMKIVEKFVESSLTLPSIQDTVGGLTSNV